MNDLQHPEITAIERTGYAAGTSLIIKCEVCGDEIHGSAFIDDLRGCMCRTCFVDKLIDDINAMDDDDLAWFARVTLEDA